MMYNGTEHPQWFTSDHVSHDPKWFCVSLNPQRCEEITVCVACVVEILEDEDQLQVKKKMVLGQVVNILHSQKGQFVSVLSEDSRVAAHMSLIILDLTLQEDENFAGVAAEVLYSILMALQNEEILGCIVDQIALQSVKFCNYKKCLAMFNLLGKLQHNVPLLSAYIKQNNASLIDVICTGIGYPDPQVQCSVTYICVELYKHAKGDGIPAQLSEQVAGHLLQILSSASQTQELTINLLGLLKTMLEVPKLPEIFMNITNQNTSKTKQVCNSSFSGAMKRVLLSRVDVLQVAGVQCIVTLLRGVNQHPDETIHSYIGMLLKEDIAGVESIVRSLDQVQKLKNSDLQTRGIKLLTKLLANHSGNIRLFSGSGLLNQCVGIISTAILHNTQTLSLAATECLEQLFRKDHITTPPPYSKFIIALQNLITKFHEQPPMTCNPPSGTGERSTEIMSRRASFDFDVSNVTTPTPKSKKERNIALQQHKSARTQQWVYRLLAVISKAISLVLEIGDDPVQNEQTYAQLDNQSNSGMSQKPSSCQDMLMALLNIVDETCIPAVLMNSSHFTDPGVLSYIYGILTYVLQVSNDEKNAVAERIATLGFITHALQSKAKFSERRVHMAANEFLQRLLAILVLAKTEGGPDLKQNLREGIDQLHGDLNSVVQLLEQNITSCKINSTLIQENKSVCFTALCLLYHSALYFPQSLTDVHMYSAISSVIDSECDMKKMKTASKPFFMYIVYLFTCSVNMKDESEKFLPNKNTSESLLLECIKNCNSPSEWCSPSVGLLNWSFSAEHITDICGKPVLNCLLFNSDVENYQAKIQTMATTNSNFVKVLMMMITCQKEKNLSDHAFTLLKNLISQNSWGEVRPEVQALLKTYLPEFTQRLFLHQNHESKDHAMKLILQLMCKLKLRTIAEPFTGLDIKILLQVFKLMENKQNNGKENLTCWEFVNIYLLQAKFLQDDRVCSMLLNHSTLIQNLEEHINEPGKVHHVFVFTLGMVLDQIHMFNTKMDIPSICLPIEQFSRPVLISDDYLTTCCVLIFWISNFRISEKALHKSTINESNEPLSETDISLTEKKGTKEGDTFLSEVECQFYSLVKWRKLEKNCQIEPCSEVLGQLSDKDIRVLYIYLQQCIMKEQALTSDLAILCLDKLLTFARNNCSVYEHLQSQRWMSFVISEMYSMYNVHDMSHFSRTLLFFSAVLLKHRIKYIKPHMGTLIQLISNTPSSPGEAEQLAMIFCLEQVIQNDISPIDPKQKTMLDEKLQILMSLNNAQNNSVEESIYKEFLKLYPEVTSL